VLGPQVLQFFEICRRDPLSLPLEPDRVSDQRRDIRSMLPMIISVTAVFQRTVIVTDRLRPVYLQEPPGADPHAGWCGGWGRKTPGYPISRLSLNNKISIRFADDNTWRATTRHFYNPYALKLWSANNSEMPFKESPYSHNDLGKIRNKVLNALIVPPWIISMQKLSKSIIKGFKLRFCYITICFTIKMPKIINLSYWCAKGCWVEIFVDLTEILKDCSCIVIFTKIGWPFSFSAK